VSPLSILPDFDVLKDKRSREFSRLEDRIVAFPLERTKPGFAIWRSFSSRRRMIPAAFGAFGEPSRRFGLK
jgi:hypothetical protein